MDLHEFSRLRFDGIFTSFRMNGLRHGIQLRRNIIRIDHAGRPRHTLWYSLEVLHVMASVHFAWLSQNEDIRGQKANCGIDSGYVPTVNGQITVVRASHRDCA